MPRLYGGRRAFRTALHTKSVATIRTERRLPGGWPGGILPPLGLVLPASAAATMDEIAFAREQLEAVGLKVIIGKHVYDRWGYFAGHDRDRATDINAFFSDDAIAGVVCYTGGWGSPRVLPYLDYELIARKPKVLIGYSDITALLNAVHQRSNLVTFQGPVGGSTFEPYTPDNFRPVGMTAPP